jgi:pantoate--beta-alanine ligase
MSPTWVTTVAGVRECIAPARAKGQRIGLVPTMGALHEGHASLLARGRNETGFLVVSIFVNPTQFGPREDLSRYPRTPEKDWELCTSQGVDLVFAPEPETIYPYGYRTYVEVHALQDVWEGASRPGHFRGVATVVAKLLNIVQPDVAYFGQKDAQQAVVIRAMVRDLNMPVDVRVCPTVREPDGLAISSRNRYLSSDQRPQAAVLFKALEAGRGLIEEGETDPATIERTIVKLIAGCPAGKLDYVAIVNADSLAPLSRIEGTVLIALAARFGNARLIDNVIVSTPAAKS